nr:MAG TPA: hypothetical protein [Bacteriophage sp.]
MGGNAFAQIPKSSRRSGLYHARRRLSGRCLHPCTRIMGERHD